MNFAVLRNKQQVDDFCRMIKEHSLPLAVAYEAISRVRSLDANEYLWGVVYTMIADWTGQDKMEVHEGYKHRFNFKRTFKYNKKKDRYELVVGTQSTASMYTYEFWEYIMKVRADAEIELGITIPMPNEIL